MIKIDKELDKFIKQQPSTYIEKSSRDYSVYVCENRAIPKISDGLKDGQRKALWLMRNRADKIKTISLAGEMISSELYLHGDASASQSISMLAAPYINNVPFFEGIGNFGTRIAPVEGIGAPRYTYVKRSKNSESLLLKDLDIVELKDNHDGSNKEPVSFLPIIPTVLLNGVSGIAVGWSTEILPRSLSDLIDATVNAIDGKKVKKLKPTYEYLDLDVENLEGNTWQFTGKVEIVDTSTCKIVELPPSMTLEKLKKRLDELEETDTIKDWIDRSTDFIDVTVTFKRGTLKDYKNNDTSLIDLFKLREKKTERIVVVDWNNNSIKQYNNAEDVVKSFVDWRFKYYIKRYQKFLDDDSYELKYWQALKLCFDNGLSSWLPSAKNKEAVVKEVLKISKTVKPDESQVDKIVSLPSYRWAKDYYQEVKAKIKELEDSIKSHNLHLKKPDMIKQVFKNEVLELKKLKVR